MGYFEKYRTDGWRWRYKAMNGNIIAQSSEAYVAEHDCDRSIEIMRNSGNSPIR